VGSLKYIAGLPAPYPGLAAQGINPTTGTFNGQYVVCCFQAVKPASVLTALCRLGVEDLTATSSI
jgi:hypothetical protein